MPPLDKFPKLSRKEKELLRSQLYERDGRRCHYCGIYEEDFPKIWGESFYGGFKRGRILEIDRKDNNQDYSLENSVLACALCKMAKSDKFTYDEFRNVGNVIRKIKQEHILLRKQEGISLLEDKFMAENIVHEKIEPAMRSLDERVAMLEERLKTGEKTVEDYTKENPLMALGVALLVGAGLGFILGKAAAKSRD